MQLIIFNIMADSFLLGNGKSSTASDPKICYNETYNIIQAYVPIKIHFTIPSGTSLGVLTEIDNVDFVNEDIAVNTIYEYFGQPVSQAVTQEQWQHYQLITCDVTPNLRMWSTSDADIRCVGPRPMDSYISIAWSGIDRNGINKIATDILRLVHFSTSLLTNQDNSFWTTEYQEFFPGYGTYLLNQTTESYRETYSNSTFNEHIRRAIDARTLSLQCIHRGQYSDSYVKINTPFECTAEILMSFGCRFLPE